MADFIRWQFIESRREGEALWAWRRMRADGSVEAHSRWVKTYGRAVRDALENGFVVHREHWVVVTRLGITHYQPGLPPTTVPAVKDISRGKSRQPEKFRAKRPEERRRQRDETPETGPPTEGRARTEEQ